MKMLESTKLRGGSPFFDAIFEHCGLFYKKTNDAKRSLILEFLLSEKFTNFIKTI
jgi:hypothetical protein